MAGEAHDLAALDRNEAGHGPGRLNATSASLAHASLKFFRTQAITLCFSGASARRSSISASRNLPKAARESGRSYSLTSMSIAFSSLQAARRRHTISSARRLLQSISVATARAALIRTVTGFISRWLARIRR